MLALSRKTFLAGTILILIVVVGGSVLIWRHFKWRHPSFTVMRPVAVQEIGDRTGRLPTEERAEPQPVEHSGSFAIETDPTDARVTIEYNGEKIEKTTPLTLTAIRFLGTEVELSVKIAKEGYRTKEGRYLLTEERPDLKVRSLLELEKEGRVRRKKSP